MLIHSKISPAALIKHIKNGHVKYAGNVRLKIYGHLNCKSGKRMKVENRIFFTHEKEAIDNGFRPCGHCMNKEYKIWKNGVV